MKLTELERAVFEVPEDTFRAYLRACGERGEPATPAGLLEYAGAHNPVSAVERAYIAAMERRYPGTRWSRTGGHVSDQGGVVRRTLVAEDDPEAFGHRLAPAVRAPDDHRGE
jgi:hypothetical protein